jgi:hypothetical protein
MDDVAVNEIGLYTQATNSMVDLAQSKCGELVGDNSPNSCYASDLK